jgi:hypothetical protein
MIARCAIAAFLLTVTGPALFGDPPTKAERTERLTAVVARIHTIAKEGYTDATWPLIREEIDGINPPDDLKSLVLVLDGLLTPQNGDESYDFALEATIRACVRRLAAMPTKESSIALRSLQPLIGSDASLGLQEAIDQQAQIMKDHVP